MNFLKAAFRKIRTGYPLPTKTTAPIPPETTTPVAPETTNPVLPDTPPPIKLAFPPGHFYSPLVDTENLNARIGEIWLDQPDIQGVDFNDRSHQHLLEAVFPALVEAYDYPEQLDEDADLTRYFTRNSQFGWLDSRTLFVMIRHLKPARIIEIGSGFSSLLTADVNHRFLQGASLFSCIEPYPREFLRKEIPGLTELITRRVEDIPVDYFSSLSSGDILFIDSSHVSKTGSDVNYLVFEILPRLKPGVVVHIHDIFLPHEYPQEWVLGEERNWNEQYVIRALLMFSTAFKVIFGSSYAFYKYPALVETALGLSPGKGFGGSSLWIERI